MHTPAIWLQLYKAEMHMLEYITVRIVCVCFYAHKRIHLCENACGFKVWLLSKSAVCI